MPIEEIAKLEEKTVALEQLEAEKERLASRLADAQIELSKLKEQKDAEDSLELIQAKKQVDELIEKNERLKKEVVQSQQEIGEVLISAKKQANRTIEEAQVEAKHLISSAELELENISNRAKKILIEVSESRKNVLSIYDDLEFKVEALSNGTLLKEIKKKKQDQKLADYFD
jgi:cell division septum initiation protein DivIVA